jgi:hypothetical protein
MHVRVGRGSAWKVYAHCQPRIPIQVPPPVLVPGKGGSARFVPFSLGGLVEEHRAKGRNGDIVAVHPPAVHVHGVL